MSVKATTKWLTVCLHYNEPWEEFLAKAVKPYVDVVLQTGVSDRFFFQRSWERGPHIRLHFRGNSYILESMLKPNLSEYFLQYFESRPSLLIHPHYPAGFPEALQWLPNHSIRFLTEDKDAGRERGKLKKKCCEKQYQATAQLVLDILKDKFRKWNFAEMTSTAIKLHLGFAYAAGFNVQEAQAFFQWMTEKWMERHEKASMKHEKFTGKTSRLQSFSNIFELQKKDIVPYHAALWELLKNYRKIEEKQFIKWFHTSTSTCIELGLALESGKLASGKNHEESMDERMDEHPLWGFYAEFIYLLNNQLGITSHDEGYLFYGLFRSLQTMRQGLNSFSKMNA